MARLDPTHQLRRPAVHTHIRCSSYGCMYSFLVSAKRASTRILDRLQGYLYSLSRSYSYAGYSQINNIVKRAFSFKLINECAI
ncbi:uncharacterized protein HELO_2941I [Halomonas elongata DSM 2581]|uniref:Uncharacterized protein n=1 Tax=Halomonas elongata (strain ATCC 33173 / DSM 2581 / NBRC 15536 / NCIMB 2198 / 1H9) TaxID=768066 RepID=A0A1R4A4J0_HALED|nr:uncharacterized protein HELO_2941I [Halomonas elongata DSM 2581]